MASKRDNCPSEAQEQEWLFEWAAAMRGRHPELELMFHVANEGTASVKRGKLMKAIGVKAGVPDVFLPVPKGRYCGLAIEMKSLRGRPSAQQLIWIDRLRAVGWRAEVCHGWHEAAVVIGEYLNA